MVERETGAIVLERTRQRKSYKIFLGVSAVHFGDGLGEEVAARARVKASWMLSTSASKNKTHRDASLFTSSWHPLMFGELEISRCREKALCRNWKPSHLAGFSKSAEPLCTMIPGWWAIGCWSLGACQSLGVSD